MAYTPSGVAVRQFIHYGQLINNDKFCQFNYDNKWTNRRIYGRNTPPSYNLTQITASINLYYTKGDDIGTIEDTIRLKNQLKNVKSTYLVPVDDFGHIDFGFSRYAKAIVYKQLLGNLNKANGKN